MKFGYARVSTLGQDLQEQVAILMEQGVKENHIYAEKYTGSTKERPRLKEMMGILRDEDELVVAKLDRLGRDSKDLMEIVDELTKKGVKVHFLDIGTVDNSATGRLLFQVMTAFAEFERRRIIERMQGGRAYKRATDPTYKEGRKKKRYGEHEFAIYEYRKSHSIRDTAKAFATSESTVKRICRVLREREENKAEKEKKED
ncbi:recombinase family protein [Ligilactobacillus equi]